MSCVIQAPHKGKKSSLLFKYKKHVLWKLRYNGQNKQKKNEFDYGKINLSIVIEKQIENY